MPVFIFLCGVFFYIYGEISLLVLVGSKIGVLPLIFSMITISALGLWLIKWRGMITIWKIRSQISEGKMPTQAVISSLFFTLAGILLLIPGFLSDILAILLLLPITQYLLQKRFSNYFVHKIRFTSFGSRFYSQRDNQNTFDAEFERQQDEDKWIK